MLINKFSSFRWVLIMFVLAYVLFIGYVSYNNSQSDRFGDEVAHLVGGSYVRDGKVMYDDLQFNHQPLNYSMSAFVEEITHPDNLFLYVSKQRLAVFGYGAVWDMLYVIAFGPISLLFILFFEILKFPYAGHKLLGETLATYPLVFIASICIQSLFFQKSISKWKLIMTSIASFIAGFSLLPLWVVIAPMNLIIFLKQKNKKQTLLYLAIPFIILAGILFLFISPVSLLRETVTYNVQYFLPVAEQFRPSIRQVLLFPFFAFIPPFGDMKVIVMLFLVQFLVSGYVMHHKKKIFHWFVLFGILIFTNFFRVNDSAFASFHLLPWIGILVMSESIFVWTGFRDKSNIIQHITLGKIIIYGFLFIYMIITLNHFIMPKDRVNEFYVQYSESEKYGRAIHILKDSDDRLMVVPNDPLIYWVADIDTATRLLEYYPWIYPIPEYNTEIRNVIINNPPEFFVETGLDLTEELDVLMRQVLDTKYTQIKHLSEPSRLYILDTKLQEISNTQWSELQYTLFEQP